MILAESGLTVPQAPALPFWVYLREADGYVFSYELLHCQRDAVTYQVAVPV